MAILNQLISGGQTGVDRGALDAAIELGVAHGGWCPAGRRAEDGVIPRHYRLQETDSATYAVRTERNVLDSDATIILCRGLLRGGTRLTRQIARRLGKPCLVVDLDFPPDPETVLDWLAREQVQVLNVAGPRESQCRGIAAAAKAYLKELLAAS